MSFAVVCPTRTLANIGPCVAAIQANEPNLPLASIVVVDDDETGRVQRFCESHGVTRILGAKPFIFSRAINSGVKAAIALDPEVEGVVLTNDDALLQTPGGYSVLAKAAADYPEMGIVASTCNNVGNRAQFPRGIGLRTDDRMVCFVTVFIPRSTFEKVGMLDEEFVGYGFEDDSYCLRIRRAGLKIGIHDGCYADHGSLTSTFRGDPKTPASLEQNAAIYKQKWGEDNFGRKA